jgi:hypothetical protein
VYVIGHQAVSQNPHARLRLIFSDQSQVERAISDCKKYVLAIRPSLGNVIGQPGSYHSCIARHLLIRWEKVKKLSKGHPGRALLSVATQAVPVFPHQQNAVLKSIDMMLRGIAN